MVAVESISIAIETRLKVLSGLLSNQVDVSSLQFNISVVPFHKISL